jgi:hypothetical protein
MRFGPSSKTRSQDDYPRQSNCKKRIRRNNEGDNGIGRCFCRLKNWRRIAPRYDELAHYFLSAPRLDATLL